MALKSKPLEQVRPSVPTAAAQEAPVRINLNVSKPTRTAWKTAALELDTNLTDLIHAAMKEYLNAHLRI